MNQVSRKRDPLSILFSYPFRIFFLSLAVWAIVAVLLWVPMVSGKLTLPLALPALHWHQHEMLFGVLSAAIAGFLLTAVCVWTQTDRLHGIGLLALWGVWLLGRLLITFGDALPEALVLGVNLLFLPLVMLDAGQRIWRARQRRQLVILLALALIWFMQIGFLLAAPRPFIDAAMLCALLLMLVIGGRITPAFSIGWMRAQGKDPSRVQSHGWLELLTIISSLLLVLAVGAALSDSVVILLSLLAAAASGLRLLLWRGWLVRAEPLLWILHLSLLWIPLSLLLLAGGRLGWWGATVWLHAAGIGAMGGLILGVIARVCLGHTGRPLQLPSGMVFAFVALHVGALVRVATAMAMVPWQPGVLLSGLCWVLAFALFLWRYWAILISPRFDGAPD